MMSMLLWPRQAAARVCCDIESGILAISRSFEALLERGLDSSVSNRRQAVSSKSEITVQYESELGCECGESQCLLGVALNVSGTSIAKQAVKAPPRERT
jgi:hypothetical protein